jgi:hypothetical protein
MHTRRFERKALATLFLAASVAFAGACMAIEHAHAQGANATPHAQGRNPFPSTSSPLLNQAPSMPPPAFNPSSSRLPSRRQVRDRYLDQVRAPGLIELSDEYC